MSIEENKAIVTRFAEVVVNGGHYERRNEFLSPDFVDHGRPPGIAPMSVVEFLNMFRTAFPDLSFATDMVIAEGDLVVQYTTAHGTMTRPLFGIPPTNKHATWPEIHITRIADGKIAEHWAVTDHMQQLGLIPRPGSPTLD
jgi:predicted ester cyclase